ncbi:MAG: tyrosine-type recombinase/integrase [Rhodoferax sp.]|nr:tyrosine-type recombinase/integrase [Rhodoferax sp.]
MSRVDEFLHAAERANTRRSYASAIQHFEVEWKGLLPATSEAVARYLADHASSLSNNTLRQRLAALSRWHSDQGFADPTKAPIVRQVLKGIRSLHPAIEKRARPLILDQLEQVDSWLQRAVGEARMRGDQPRLLRHTRDRSMVLLGFWRGFRSDELIRLKLENIQISPGEGITCYLERSKTDTDYAGREFKCPALSRLCPVTALGEWTAAAGLSAGPVFRKIDRWGHVAQEALGANSLIPILRCVFAAAGLASAQEYSSHSLRRGFAAWARASGWDIKELMEYVGWKDIKSAMRYLEASDASLQARFEHGLAMPGAAPSPITAANPPAPAAAISEAPVIPMAVLRVKMTLDRFNKLSRGWSRAHRLIEKTCFERYAMQRLDAEGTEYELRVPCPSRDGLEEAIYALLDDMYRVADANQCRLEASIHEPTSGAYWS